MYLKEFEVRWSDIDANRHLANSAYINFMSHTRMSYLIENGFDQRTMAQHNIGPVVFYEHVHFFKETFQGANIRVSFELGGVSKDGTFFKFIHNFYDHKGRNLAFCEMQGGWLDLEKRKLTPLPANLIEMLDKAPKTANFKLLTSEDMRSKRVTPRNLES